MDNRNVKIVDENNIDREGKVICGFNNEYVLYYISRDSENDNLFVSKVINNLDGTANMISIEDSNEKANIDTLARELVKHSYEIVNDSEIMNDNKVNINGKDVNINSVLFNKEQSIVVSKTYVATVKHSVAEKAFNFYKVNNVAKKEENVFEDNNNTIFDSVFSSKEPENVSVNQVATEPVVDVSQPVVKEEPIPSVVSPAQPSVLPASEPVSQESKFDETVASLIADDKGKELQNQESSTVTPVTPVAQPTEMPSAIPNTNVATAPILPTDNGTLNNGIQNDSKMNIVVGPVEEKKEEVKTEPIPVTPVSVIPTANSVNEVSQQEPKLFFDGSKETNLNTALGEASNDKVVASEASDVQTLREFGTSDKVLENNATNTEPVSNGSKGFANNKFFTVIAVLLFVAACVFLGYEAIQYFTMTK